MTLGWKYLIFQDTFEGKGSIKVCCSVERSGAWKNQKYIINIIADQQKKNI